MDTLLGVRFPGKALKLNSSPPKQKWCKHKANPFPFLIGILYHLSGVPLVSLSLRGVFPEIPHGPILTHPNSPRPGGSCKLPRAPWSKDWRRRNSRHTTVMRIRASWRWYRATLSCRGTSYCWWLRNQGKQMSWYMVVNGKHTHIPIYIMYIYIWQVCVYMVSINFKWCKISEASTRLTRFIWMYMQLVVQ